MKFKSYIYPSFILTVLLGTLVYTSISPIFADAGSDVTLSAVKSDNTDVAKPGEMLTYSIILTNSSSEDVMVNVVDHLPDSLLPVATSPEAQADADARTITWNQINVPASDEIALGLQAQIADTAPNNHVVENKAEITGPNVQLTVTDLTRVEATTEPVTAAPIQPTAATGASHNIIFIALLALIAGTVIGRKIIVDTV